MLLGTIIFLAVPQVLLGFFNASGTMLAIGIPALRIIASTFVVAGVCIVLSSGVPGAGLQPLFDARLPGAPADRAGAGGLGAGHHRTAGGQRRFGMALLPGGGGRLGGG